MSDDLVKRLRDDSGDWLTDLAADRIEELEAKLATCEKYRDAYDKMGRIGTEAYRDLEAKLAKAVGHFKKLRRRQDSLETFDAVVNEIVETALAELKGDPDAKA